MPAHGPVRLVEVGCGSGAHIRAAGYTDVEALPLMSGGMYVGLVATWPGSLGADAAER